DAFAEVVPRASCRMAGAFPFSRTTSSAVMATAPGASAMDRPSSSRGRHHVPQPCLNLLSLDLPSSYLSAGPRRPGFGGAGSCLIAMSIGHAEEIDLDPSRA